MNKRLFVAGLPFSTTEDELKNLFADIGNVVSVKIITDRMTGQSKGFGFVEMETEDEATSAVSKLNGSDLGGRKLVVAEAKPMEDHGPRERGGDSRGGHSEQRRSFSGKPRGRGQFGGGRSSGGRSFRGGRY